MKTKRIVCFLLLFLILFLVIFVVLNKSVKDNVKQDKKMVIGFCTDTMIVERWQKDKDILLSMAKERNMEVITLNANEDNERQVKQIKQLIDAKVDAIIVIPYDKDGLKEVLKKAHNKGIIVISYDRLTKDTLIDAYVSFDNEKSGIMMAKALMDIVPEGNYVIINGSSKDNNSFMLNVGYKKALNNSIKKGKIKIIDEVWAENWREEIAYGAIIKNLEQGKNIDGIIASNDRLAEAAIKALAEYGLAGDVGIVGQDADIIACQQIIKGVQTATIYKPIKELVSMTLDVLVNLYQGKEIEGYDWIDNGYQQVKYYSIQSILVDETNMKEAVIDDGFHREEDVFRH